MLCRPQRQVKIKEKSEPCSQFLTATASSPNLNASFVPNDVQVVDKSYMSRSFFSKDWQKTIDSVSVDFALNKEQDHAF